VRDNILMKLFSVSIGLILLSLSLFSIGVAPSGSSGRKIQVALQKSAGSTAPALVLKEPIRVRTLFVSRTPAVPEKTVSREKVLAVAPAPRTDSEFSLLKPFREEKKSGSFFGGTLYASASENKPAESKVVREPSRTIDKLCRIELSARDNADEKNGLSREAIGTLIAASSSNEKNRKNGGIVVFRF